MEGKSLAGEGEVTGKWRRGGRWAVDGGGVRWGKVGWEGGIRMDNQGKEREM
jgi:hypothetical protein